VELEGQRKDLQESEVNTMQTNYTDTGGNVREEIQLLNSISRVSARLARNLSILAAQRQSEKGERTYEQNSRHETDNRRTPQCCCRY
jgi:hypothetical protein